MFGKTRWLAILAGLSIAAAACGLHVPGTGPTTPPPPPAPETRIVALTVSPHGAVGTLMLDSGDLFSATADENGRLTFTIPYHATGGADLRVSSPSPGYRAIAQHVALDPELLAAPLDLPRAIQRVHVEQRRFVTEDGKPFIWNGVTAFRLVHLVASGDIAGADAFLAWCEANHVTVVRVLTVAWNLFRLDAELGHAALPQLLELAAQHGVHVEVVALADTVSYTFDHRTHVAAIGAACAVAPSCLAVELANEPVHPTQTPQVADPAYLRELAKLVPDNVLRALGPAGATIAESDERYVEGSDYMPIHEERQDDGSGVRWVRHLNDLREISEKVGKPVVNDEPQRTDLARDNHFGAGALTRLFGLGDTFHYAGGLQAQIPAGAELDAFAGRTDGWASLPADWTGGRYCNVGLADCPATSADWNTVVKLYAAIQGGQGYAVAVGAKGAPAVVWGNGFSQELLKANGRSVLWKVIR